jgi:hypothetical protein
MVLQSSTSTEIATSSLEAIARSRNFLETKLRPDLEQTTALLKALEQKRDNYLRLQELIRSSKFSGEEERGEKNKEQYEPASISSLAHLGQGVHLPVEIQSDALMIVSLGLGTTESAQGWDTDSGLYVQLTSREASVFSGKKVGILTK